MSTSIEKVPGIGPATATLLADNGINNAEDLAAKRVGDLAAIKGFNTVRAAQVIEAARQQTGVAGVDTPAQAGTPSKKIKDKKDKEKKDKEKKDKKTKKSKDLKKKTAQGEKSKTVKDKKKSAPKKGKDKKKSAGSKKKSSKKK
ncbi:MAG: helix-hairpin-helix domain-containing protein [Desulfuromonadaceae bacterium]